MLGKRYFCGPLDPWIRKFIRHLIQFTNVDKAALDEIYNGAFVILQDGGYFYRIYGKHGRLCNLDAIPSESSHDSEQPQYRLGNGTLTGIANDGTCDTTKMNSRFDLLMGTSLIENFYGNTWFQFEYANMLTWVNKWPLHGYAYLQHLATHKNIGPFGSSEYTEYTKCIILNRGTRSVFDTSRAFLEQHNIHLPYYQKIKNFVKSSFHRHERYSIRTVTRVLEDYVTNTNLFTDTVLVNVFKKMALYLKPLCNDVIHGTMVLKLFFLIFYYITTPDQKDFETTLTEIKHKMKRY
jgi:hypothetical protein